jgi:hypothetical protein
MQDYSAIRLAVAEDCCATLLQREFLRIIKRPEVLRKREDVENWRGCKIGVTIRTRSTSIYI